MRTVIVHCHLYKNAGSTLDWSLQRNFGDHFCAHADDAQIQVDAAYLGAYLAERPDLHTLSSHQVQFPMPQLDGVRILPIVLLRHPIDRVGSVYAFLQRQKEPTRSAIKAKQVTFAEYVKWGMESSSGAPIRNFQTRRCSQPPVRARAQVREEDFSTVLHMLEQESLVGLVERYDESMVVFEEVLRPFYPSINLAYVKRNVTANRKATLDERIKDIRTSLGPDVAALLEEHNQWDQRLYEKANAKLSERIQSIPDFEERLVAFRKRCWWVQLHNRLHYLHAGGHYLVMAWKRLNKTTH